MIRGRKPQKVPYDEVRRRWHEAQRNFTGLTKAQLARDLQLSIRTVRNILNGYYDERESKAKTEIAEAEAQKQKKRRGLMIGW
jgi:DNA-binding XRE family transcriptional regulator